MNICARYYNVFFSHFFFFFFLVSFTLPLFILFLFVFFCHFVRHCFEHYCKYLSCPTFVISVQTSGLVGPLPHSCPFTRNLSVSSLERSHEFPSPSIHSSEFRISTRLFTAVRTGSLPWCISDSMSPKTPGFSSVLKRNLSSLSDGCSSFSSQYLVFIRHFLLGYFQCSDNIQTRIRGLVGDYFPHYNSPWSHRWNVWGFLLPYCYFYGKLSDD